MVADGAGEGVSGTREVGSGAGEGDADGMVGAGGIDGVGVAAGAVGRASP